jgi:predicted Zn-dependent protease
VKRLLPVLLTLALLPACAEFSGERSGNGVLSSNNDVVILFSQADEVALGQQTAAAALKDYKPSTDKALLAYVDGVGQRLAGVSERPGLKYSFTVLDAPDVNAFACPGGFVFITTGILKNLKDESELAAVLGHEVGHVVKQHTLKRMQRQAVADMGLDLVTGLLGGKSGALAKALGPIASNLVLLRNGREAELESDELGMQEASRLGYDPAGMIGVQQMLLAQTGKSGGKFDEMLATHPPSEQRIQQAQALLPKYQGPTGRGAADYKKNVLDRLK